MKSMKYLTGVAAALIMLASPVSGAEQAPAARDGAAKHKVIIQVSDNDARKWTLALNNVRNIQQDLGRDNVVVELVAYGPGLDMLKLESAVASRVAAALAEGVAIVACENTMANTKTKKDDMLPNIGYVKAGVVELMLKQQQGYAYIRP
jgi:uncharacterized protein